MYSPRVIERRMAEVEQATGIRLHRYSIDEAKAITEHLSHLWDSDDKATTRALKPEEKEFIRNERLLSAIDYRYHAERYHHLIGDGTGFQTFSFWESQQIVLEIISSMQEQQLDAQARGEPCDGILLVVHKARQLGMTMLLRSVLVHRVTTHEHVRAISASVQDEKVLKLYERDKRIIDNLPWWLKPSMGFDEKAQHMTFDKLDSHVLYQEFAQKTGIGEGEQWDVGHMTETGVLQTNFLESEYFPTIPYSPNSLHAMESRAYGRGNWWHLFVEDIRKGGSRWKFVFLPWYAERTKYRRQPPVGWEPTELSMLHAQMVHDTSFEFINRQVMLSREQLYWWETTRAEYQRKNNLRDFLILYCATPEESFQHSGQSVFSFELLDFYRTRVSIPQAYEVRGA